MTAHPRFHVTVLELVQAAQRAGFNLSPHEVITAARRCELHAACTGPWLFTADEANRWLNAWMHAQEVQT